VLGHSATGEGGGNAVCVCIYIYIYKILKNILLVHFLALFKKTTR